MNKQYAIWMAILYTGFFGKYFTLMMNIFVTGQPKMLFLN